MELVFRLRQVDANNELNSPFLEQKGQKVVDKDAQNELHSPLPQL